MNRFRAIVALLVAAGSLAPLGAHAGETPYTGAGSQVSGSASYMCIGAVTVTKAGVNTTFFYMSSPVTVLRTQHAALEEAWRRHLEELHPYFGSAPDNCGEQAADSAAAKANRQSLIDQWKGKAQIVEETFVYNGPISHDPQMRFFCESWSGDRKTLYLTGTFDVPPTQDVAPVTMAWRNYAQKTLGLTQYASGCDGGAGWDGIKKHEGRKEMLAGTAGSTLHAVVWTYGGANAPAAQPSTPPTIAAPPTVATLPTIAAPPAVAQPTQAPATAGAMPSQSAQSARTWACQTDFFSPPGPQRVHVHYLSDLFSSSQDYAHIVSAWNSHIATTYHLVPATTGTCAPFSQARMDQLEQQLGLGGVQTVRVPWQG